MTGGRLGQKPNSVRLRWRALRSVFRSRFGPAVYGVTDAGVGQQIPEKGSGYREECVIVGLP